MARRNSDIIPIRGLPDRMRKSRKNAGYSIRKVAKELGITHSAYYNYEIGLSEPCLSALVKISTLFKVSTNYLLGIRNSENFQTEEEG